MTLPEGAIVEYRSKDEWPEGEWTFEPDHVRWTDAVTGFACMVNRIDLGSLCGYVGIPDGHPLYGLAYDECRVSCGESWCEHTIDARIDVHGGVTWTGPDPTRTDTTLWWIGFDTAHAYDLVPGMLALSHLHFHHEGDTYRDIDAVIKEVQMLAMQILALQLLQK